jgi:hypothetical protein
MKIAAYVRPWSKDYYEYFLPRTFPGQEYFLLSDWKGLGQFDWSGAFYRRYKGPADQARTPHWLTSAVEYEIIARNFLLRSLSLAEASHLVRCMSSSIDEMLEQVQPNLVLSPAVDSYVMDLLMRHCIARSIPYCGMLPSPVTGYTRITAVGEQLNFREPTNAEVEEAVHRIADPSFTPVDLAEWMKMYGNSNVCLKRALRELPKPYAFPLLGWLRGDPQNYHYRASSQTRVSFMSQALLIDRYFDERWLDRIRNWPGTKVYIPLQAFPECTTDYHVEHLDLIDFPRLLPRLIDALCSDGNNLVCLKEHPGMMGVRPPGFYDAILRRHNVVLLSGNIPASSLIAETDVLVTWTGTGGLEAAIRGKPVVTIGKPYYSVGATFSNIMSIADLDNAAAFIRRIRNRTPNAEEKFAIAKHVLAGTFPGEYRFIRFSKTNPSLVSDADALARGTLEHWDAWANANAAYHGFTSCIAASNNS